MPSVPERLRPLFESFHTQVRVGVVSGEVAEAIEDGLAKLFLVALSKQWLDSKQTDVHLETMQTPLRVVLEVRTAEGMMQCTVIHREEQNDFRMHVSGWSPVEESGVLMFSRLLMKPRSTEEQLSGPRNGSKLVEQDGADTLLHTANSESGFASVEEFSEFCDQYCRHYVRNEQQFAMIQSAINEVQRTSPDKSL